MATLASDRNALDNQPFRTVVTWLIVWGLVLTIIVSV